MRNTIKMSAAISAMMMFSLSASADFNDAANVNDNNKQDSQESATKNLRPHPKHHFNMNEISNKQEIQHADEGGKYMYVPHPKGNFLIKRYIGS